MEDADTLHFIMRYTPFWAIPLGLVGFQFGRIYREKEFRKTGLCFYLLFALCTISTIIYFVTGGPDRSIDRGIEFQRTLQN
jgi:hypothetical protein